ncbi:Inner membrane protein YihY, formerly thought to be RNase BN [hydrothermal vent metagenome]|uniref:Inner membrane protein YihY, formerly thought to be RNase BN n=1 Tax=hydrothermal vent metagenome TaxID=652676 RepID=A0A1W1ED23_9ZZZZ
MSTRKILRNYYLFFRDFLKDFLDDRLGYYAASLSWNTIFSIIPLLVILLYVFTTLPYFDDVYVSVQELIFANIMPTESKEIMASINTFVENSDKLGQVGFFYVTFAAIMFFKNYDYIVNDIFETEQRTIFESIKTYLVLIILLPLMMGGSFYLSNFIQTYLLDQTDITSFIHIYYFLPYLIVWGAFYITYQLSANVKIDVKAALTSSFIASLIWHLSKIGFVFYVVHNKTYASVYGSISTVLFFLLWIYISWAIFLHGLRFCYLLDKSDDEELEEI